METALYFTLALWTALTPLTGDVTGDQQVSLSDMAELAVQWLNTGPGWTADTNGTQTVDYGDYGIISSQWHHFRVEDLFASAGSLANWTVVDEGGIDGPSNWNISGGQFIEQTNIYGPDASAVDHRRGSYAYWNDPGAIYWADYQFDVSLRSDDNDGIGVMFRYRNPQNYYKFDMDSQRVFRKLFKVVDGVETTLATVNVGYTVGSTMQLHADIKGDQFNFRLDGVNVFGAAVTDSDIPSGTVALYNWGNQASYFDNFDILVSGVKSVTAHDDQYQVNENSTLTVSVRGVLDNDTAAAGSLTAHVVSSPDHGNLLLNPDGTFVYSPDPNFVGWDHFVYAAVSDHQDSDQASVTIRIRSATEFSIILLPDPQNYSDYAPQIYLCQTQWIVDHKADLNIAFVLHEGDFTNHNGAYEWDNADDAMSVLDGEVPYVPTVGNHDLGTGGTTDTRDATLFNQHFPVSRFDDLPQFGGVYEPGHMENSYHYFTAGGIDWLVLSLEFGPRNKVLDWANQVVSDHPHRRVIVLTHNYMYSDDTRVGPGDTWNPHDYSVCINAAGPDVCNDGEEMWTNLMKLHENISFVFSGHICNDGVGTLVSTGDYGNKVYQMLANYQFEGNGGNGWLRIITLYPDQRKVAVETYSPFLDLYKTEPEQQFEFLNVDLTTP